MNKLQLKQMIKECIKEVYVDTSFKMKPKLNLHRFNVGGKFILTQKSWKRCSDDAHSIHASPSWGFLEKLKKYIGQEGVVTHTFPPSYEFTGKFADGQAFHMKDKWVEPLDREKINEVYSGQNDYLAYESNGLKDKKLIGKTCMFCGEPLGTQKQVSSWYKGCHAKCLTSYNMKQHGLREEGEYSHEPQMRVRSDEPEPFGYGDTLDKKDTSSQMTLPPGFTQSKVEDLPSGLDEAYKKTPLNAPMKDVDDDDLDAYIKRRASGEKESGEKLSRPFIHPSVIRDETGQLIDKEELKKKIMQRPTSLLRQNSKIQKSGGQGFVFYNIGLPAVKGLIVDERTGKFKMIDTCPGAGACKISCYATRGNYVQFQWASMNMSRVLNFLVNDWVGFKRVLGRELELEQAKNPEDKLVVRWHDSGDFFSPDYLKIAFEIAKEFPDITFYAYTKVASAYDSTRPSNFIMNYSMGGLPEQEKQVDVDKAKKSVIIPKQMFADLSHKEGESGDRHLVWNSEKDLETFKDKIASKYGVERDTIITYDELMKIPYESQSSPKWSVLVWKGHGDDSAIRRDVKNTYLLWH